MPHGEARLALRQGPSLYRQVNARLGSDHDSLSSLPTTVAVACTRMTGFARHPLKPCPTLSFCNNLHVRRNVQVLAREEEEVGVGKTYSCKTLEVL